MTPVDEIQKTTSAVEVLDVGDDRVLLDLPADIRDCNRTIPQDAIQWGSDHLAWFAWDMKKKQPRSPHGDEYAGPIKWGRDNVSWHDRAGSNYARVLQSLDGNGNGYHDPGWRFNDETPRDLYPMLIIPHADFIQDDEGLILIDLDDVVNVRDDGIGELTHEAWNVVKTIDAFTEVSVSQTGLHVLVKGRMPEFVDGKKVIEDLDNGGQIEIYGYPANGRIIGTTWAHVEHTPAKIPNRQDELDELVNQLIDEEDKLTPEEQAQRVVNERQNTQTDTTNPSDYYDIDTQKIADTGPFARHGDGTRGPHPYHGGTSTPDKKSTNFYLDDGSWCCYAHDDGGGALQLIAVLERIRKCGNASDVMSDPVDALRVCLAARDKYVNGSLDDADPPLIALKGVLHVMDITPKTKDNGMLRWTQYKAARSYFDEMEYGG